jgi:quercetin dioxygenase-like cupin family protein
MRKYAMAAAVLAFASTSAILAVPAMSQGAPAAPAVVRKVLLQQDVPEGHTMMMMEVTIPVGGREGRHIHSGPLMVHVVSGAFSLDYEGKPNITYKVGDTFYVEAGKQHEGINKGTVPAVGIATIVIPKGAAPTTQVKSNGL